MRRIGVAEGERSGTASRPQPFQMVTVATAELAGRALDYAAAHAAAKKGQRVNLSVGASTAQVQLESSPGSDTFYSYDPSINLVIVSSLIEDQRISVFVHDDGEWAARAWNGVGEPEVYGFGETHLIAVTRCFVRRHFGESVEIPDVLLNEINSPRRGAIDWPVGMGWE